MRRDATRTFCAVTLLVVVFFSQLWVAAYACAMTRHSTPTNQAVLAIASDGRGDLHDHQTAAVWHGHCDNPAQPGRVTRSKPSPLVWIPLIWGGSTIPALAVHPRLPTRQQPLLLSASPPARILFQVFRN